jgi:hypothetical protein
MQSGQALEGVIPFFLLGLFVISIIWAYSRSDRLLNRWAKENGYVLLKSQYVASYNNPFPFASRGQAVCKIVVRDLSGNRRTGWVRLGNWFFGILKYEVAVKWDDEG